MKVSVVTSCSAVGWEKYGRRCVETFIKHWPKIIELHVVSEDNLTLPDGLNQLTFHRLADSIGWHKFYVKNISRGWVHGNSTVPRPNGIAPNWKLNKGYNFRFDAFKFCKKVFAVELIANELSNDDILFWLDSDTVTHSPVPNELAKHMMPDNYAISCLARDGYHAECGFIGYNLKHPQTLGFIHAFADLYSSEKVFELQEWHDSWVFDWLRNKLKIVAYNIPHKSRSHPFINSELGLYLDHLKGGRKEQGRTLSVERVIASDIAYWKDGARRV